MAPHLPGLVRRPGRGELSGGSRPRIGIACALAVGALLGCARDREGGRAATSDSLRVIDATGAEVVLPGPARRIVSLVPSATQTLRALGAESALAGRTDYDTQAWAAHVPSVGGGIEPNLEKIVVLEADLVVRFAGTQDTRTPARLDDLGIPHLAVRPDRIEDIYATTELLGRVTGRPGRAESLNRAIRSGLERVAASVAERAPLRVVYVLGGNPPWVAGPGTYIEEVIELAGGRNVFSDLGSLYAAVSPEQLRGREIDVVLLSSGATYDRSLTPGVRVEVVDVALETPGPGVVEAARRVAELLHGGIPD